MLSYVVKVRAAAPSRAGTDHTKRTLELHFMFFVERGRVATFGSPGGTGASAQIPSFEISMRLCAGRRPYSCFTGQWETPYTGP
jgi:hypothetical protein